MVYFTLFILCTSYFNYCYGFQSKFSAFGDNVVVLCALAAFGTISLIGACALCFRRKKTFEKLENEGGSPENIKKNEFPIFRALSTNESSAIVPCERNNLSRDNLLNSSDNLVNDDSSSLRKSDGIDSNDVILLEKTPNSSQRDKSQQIQRDTIIFETEKKSPSSKTPLLYAKNVQSYQEQQPINEQIQQKSVTAVFLSSNEKLSEFYSSNGDDSNKINIDEIKTEEVDEKDVGVRDESNKNTTTSSDAKSCISNPFFNSTVEDGTMKEGFKDDASEIESSINDTSEKYQILEEETDCDDAKNLGSSEDLPVRLERQNSKGSNCSTGDKSIEEALRALDVAIGFDEDEYDENDLEAVIIAESNKVNLDEIKEEATFLVDSIVYDCEKILQEKDVTTKIENEISPNLCFDDFLTLRNQDISTPCTATKTKSLVRNAPMDLTKTLLFPDGLDLSSNETFPIESAKFDDKTFDAGVPTIKIDKDCEGSEDLTTVTPVNTPIELSYSSETWNKLSYSNSKDTTDTNNHISTIVVEAQNLTYNANDHGEITFNHDGWYLHSQSKNDTFDICGGDEDEGNMEDMTSTFDQLRRQLTEMLPHAQGMSAHNDFLDDDLNKDSNSPSDNIKYGELDEATNAGAFDLLGTILNAEPVTELNINYNNYKRPLSPIMEESECDETCRTFIMNNETKLLDSTSTGVMESSAEAVMGQMPKNLMASNDTLFNFEDTLSDPTDILMSPRIHTGGSSSSSTLSRHESHDRISNERTPTNEELPKIMADTNVINNNSTSGGVKCQDAIDILKQNIRQHPLSLDLNTSTESDATSTKYELAKIAIEEGSWPLELPEAQQIVNDLSSPEQNRTADSLSFEQDITYTIDDQKTCVSLVLKNDDDERISEISEPLFASESLDVMLANDEDDDDRANSLAIDDALSLDIDETFEMNDENGNQSVILESKEIYMKEMENFDNDSINPIQNKAANFDADSLEPNVKILNEEMEADSIPASQISKSVYSNDSINENTVQNSCDNSESDCVNVKEHDSSESECSDRKKEDHLTKVHMSTSLTDFLLYNEIFHVNEDTCGGTTDYDDFSCQYHNFENCEDCLWGSSSQDIRQVSCNESVMSTSFTKEWSDDDSSHSSEEFMYVKGEAGQLTTTTGNEDEEAGDDKENGDEKKDDQQKDSDDANEMEYQTWDIRTMPHRKSPPLLEDVGGSEDEESGEDEEFVPSCWDQSLQPSKSSLKSPEKESSPDQEKEEPQIKTKRRVVFKIQRYHSVYEYPSEVIQLSPAYSEPQLWSNYLDDCSGNIDYFAYSNQLNDIPNTMDGFSISSSSRPFHNNVQLHNTWPNETDRDFSWSQFQDTNNDAMKLNETPLKIEWPIRKNIGFDEDDSGLCESSESPLIGELNYSKNSMKLPLELISSTSSEVSDFMSTDTKELEAVDESFKPKTFSDQDDDLSSEKQDALPTPLGSIDSLSSNSSSSNSPPSFTTFGKENKILKESDVICNSKKSIIFIEDDRLTQLEKRSKNSEAIDKKKVTVGSSDDDSGFENVKCEAK